MSKAFQALQAEGDRTGWPQAYRNDLEVHDRNRLEASDPPPVFGWVLGKSHTYLLDARMDGGSRRGYMDHLRIDASGDRLYFWNGLKLATVSSVEELDLLMLAHSEDNTPAGEQDPRGAY